MQMPSVTGFNAVGNPKNKDGSLLSSNQAFAEGGWLTIDGATGEVFAGKALVESKPWNAHSELALLDLLVEKAVASGRVPPKAAGAVWRIRDFLRHGRPLTDLNYEAKAAPEKRRVLSASSGKKADIARKTLHPLHRAEQANFSEFFSGLIATLERLFQAAANRRQPVCRGLWGPEQQYRPAEQSQLVGFEYFGINRQIPHLIELASIRIHLECKPQSLLEAWTIESSHNFGARVVPRCRTISGCQLWVNGAELLPEDLPQFYTWLRRREYFGFGLEET